MKTAATLLKASAWVLIFMGAAHFYGHMNGRKQMAAPPDDATRALVTAMNSYSLPDWPAPRTVMDVYEGLSLSFFAFPVFVGAMILFILPVVKDNPRAMRRLARCFTAGLAGLMAISVGWFILPPSLFLAVSLILSIAAVLASRGAAATQ
jgi:hypothetical protein